MFSSLESVLFLFQCKSTTTILKYDMERFGATFCGSPLTSELRHTRVTECLGNEQFGSNAKNP